MYGRGGRAWLGVVTCVAVLHMLDAALQIGWSGWPGWSALTFVELAHMVDATLEMGWVG